MARSLLIAAIAGVASAVPIDDAAVFVQRTTIQTGESDNGDSIPLPAPLMSGFKNIVRTFHDLNHAQEDGNVNSTMAITGSAIKRALPTNMQDFVEDVAAASIKEHWGKKNQTGNEIMARVLQLAWNQGQKDQQKLGQTVQSWVPETAKAKANRVMSKLDLMRKTVSDRAQLFSQAAQQALPEVMQTVYGATQQAFQAAQAGQQGAQPPLPWGPQAAQQAAGPQAMQAQQQFMPQMQQPQQAGQMMPQQMPYGMMPQQMQYGAMPQQMQYGAMPQQQMPYGAMPPQQTPYGAMPPQQQMQQWGPQVPQA